MFVQLSLNPLVPCKKRKLLKNAGQGENDILTRKPDQEVEDVFEGTVSFISKRTDWRTKISASFIQRLTRDGFFSLSPRLSFCAIIPDHSEIFALVENGDLKGIINLLQQGKASQSDCDSEGRTLLNVRKSCHEFLPAYFIDFMKHALHHIQVEICEFLIGKGADVDAMEPTIHGVTKPLIHDG